MLSSDTDIWFMCLREASSTQKQRTRTWKRWSGIVLPNGTISPLIRTRKVEELGNECGKVMRVKKWLRTDGKVINRVPVRRVEHVFYIGLCVLCCWVATGGAPCLLENKWNIVDIYFHAYSTVCHWTLNIASWLEVLIHSNTIRTQWGLKSNTWEYSPALDHSPLLTFSISLFIWSRSFLASVVFSCVWCMYFVLFVCFVFILLIPCLSFVCSF